MKIHLEGRVQRRLRDIVFYWRRKQKVAVFISHEQVWYACRPYNPSAAYWAAPSFDMMKGLSNNVEKHVKNKYVDPSSHLFCHSE